MIAIPVEPPITEYLHAKAARQGIPLSGTFELTPLCNMNCRMCYVRMSREQQEAIRPLRTAAQWLELGRQAKEQGLLYLLLTGGVCSARRREPPQRWPHPAPAIRPVSTLRHCAAFCCSRELIWGNSLVTRKSLPACREAFALFIKESGRQLKMLPPVFSYRHYLLYKSTPFDSSAA